MEWSSAIEKGSKWDNLLPKGCYYDKSTFLHVFLQKEMCTCWIFLKYLFMFLTAGHMNYEAHI